MAWLLPRRDAQTIYYSIASDPAREILTTLYRVYCAPSKGEASSKAVRAWSSMRVKDSPKRFTAAVVRRAKRSLGMETTLPNSPVAFPPTCDIAGYTPIPCRLRSALAQQPRDGALDEKTKMIALAISVAARCDGCIGFHTEALVRQRSAPGSGRLSASPSISRSGSSLMYAANAVSAYEQFEKQRPTDLIPIQSASTKFGAGTN